MSRDNVLIHVGYHKTGSTWLQRNFFTLPCFDELLSRQELDELIIKPHPLAFKAEALNSQIQSNKASKLKSQVAFISHERLTGAPASGAYDVKELALRLKACIDKPKILLVVREQTSAILSCYLQHIRIGGVLSFDDFLKPIAHPKTALPAFSFDQFDYMPLISFYETIFGAENIKVLPYELFKEKPLDFCSEIMKFMGDDFYAENCEHIEALAVDKFRNPSLSLRYMPLVRALNSLFCKSSFNPGGLFSPDFHRKYIQIFIQLSKSIAKEAEDRNKLKYIEKLKSMLSDYYTESNMKLSEYLDIDLKNYNYY